MTLFSGTLRDPVRLARLAGVPGLQGAGQPAMLRGWRRVRMGGGPFPTLIRVWRAQVAGVIARVAAATLPLFAAYEGSRYRLVPIVVHAPRPVRARYWIAPATRRPWPMKEA